MNGDQSELLKRSQVMDSTKVFYTGIKEKTLVEEQEGRLHKYVDHIGKKIDYARWKQELVLKYNYLPMKRLTDKIENDKANYVRKIAEEEKNCGKILSGKEITVQLDLFRDFSKKLNEKLHELQVKISDEKLNNNIIAQEVESKRLRLKQKMRQNMLVIRTTLEKQGVANKEDIIALVCSRSTKARLNPTSMTVDSNQNLTERKMSGRKLNSYQSNRQKFSHQELLFKECLDKLTGSIQAMKSSEDIQSGIYLDIMEKSRQKNYSTEGRQSAKSKISQTIHSRFGSGHLQEINNAKNKSDFQMDWETFKQLNWKQIMGIVMVKDKNCTKLKNLLKCK